MYGVHYSRCTFPLRMLWCHPNTTLMTAGSIGPEGSRGLHRARAKAHRIPRSHRITTGMAGLGLGSRRSWQKGNSSGRSSRYSHVCLYISILNCSCQEHLTFLGTLHLGFVIRIPRPPVRTSGTRGTFVRISVSPRLVKIPPALPGGY